MFAPRSVAVIGASRRDSSVGNAVVRHLLAAGFRGPVYPVNPHAGEIAGVPSYPSVSALPEVPDLAVMAIPAPAVAAAAEECGQRGVGGLLVLSAGFTDQDTARLRRAVRQYGMRMVGPNCIGVANTDPEVALDATFTKRVAGVGSVGVLTQSGGIGFAVSELLHSVGLGVSTFASVGNKYDVSGNDLLLWWRHDDRTKVAIIYLESFGNPRKFARLARQLARRTPLVVVRAGGSKVAQRAARSHTAATATPAVTRDELFRQAGVVATDDLAEAIDAVAYFSCQPLPARPARRPGLQHRRRGGARRRRVRPVRPRGAATRAGDPGRAGRDAARHRSGGHQPSGHHRGGKRRTVRARAPDRRRGSRPSMRYPDPDPDGNQPDRAGPVTSLTVISQ